MQSKSQKIILLIDANKTFNVKEQGISSVVEYTGMIDLILNKYGTSNEPNAYKKRSQIIDYVFLHNGTNNLHKILWHSIFYFDYNVGSEGIVLRDLPSNAPKRSTSPIYNQQR